MEMDKYRSINKKEIKKKILQIGMMLVAEGGFVEAEDIVECGDVGGFVEGGFVKVGDGVEGGDVGGGVKQSSARIWD